LISTSTDAVGCTSLSVAVTFPITVPLIKIDLRDAIRFACSACTNHQHVVADLD